MHLSITMSYAHLHRDGEVGHVTGLGPTSETAMMECQQTWRALL